MKKLNYLLLAVGMIFIFGCTDDIRLNRKQRRITGTWEIEKAFFRENGDIFRDNVTLFFENDLITFYDDFTALYEDSSLQSGFDGDWSLILERNDDDRVFFIDMIFYDNVNNEEFSYFAEITFLTHKKFNMTIDTGNGIQRFKLRKF